MNARAHAFASLSVLGLVALGCKGSSKTDTSAASTSSSSSSAPTASASAKAAFVDATRYPDEIQLAGALHTKKAVAARQGADATSKVVANLANDFEVGLVVARGQFVLVSVTDDGVAGQLGWVPLDTFGDVPQLAAAKASATATGPTPPKNMAKCGANEIAAGNGGAKCQKRCSSDKDCDEGDMCSLLGYWTAAGPRNGKACHNVMNGGEQVLDPFKGAPTDATGAAPTAARADSVEPNDQGDCPVDYVHSGRRCHRVCKRDSECHSPNVCVSLPVGTTKVCDQSMK